MSWRGTHRGLFAAAVATTVLAACTSVGQIGLMTRPSADAGELLRGAHPYREIGPTKGTACRYFLAAVVPWGDSTASEAFERALQKSGGDALLNVTVYSSLYGFIPIYNVFSFTCTSVVGTAISFAAEPAARAAAAPESATAPAGSIAEPAPSQ